MKKINLIILLALSTALSIIYVNQTAANSGPGMRECWHGTISQPFQDFLGLVPLNLQCPAYQHPPEADGFKKHREGDPACQNSELNPWL